jgi:uncharacterized protein (DUF934 family)
MPLVKSGRIAEDCFMRVLDDAAVPEGMPVLLPAVRFLADARELVLRAAPTGVMWPNDRAVSELAPHFDWLALIALVFPSFRDGRAYSQARLLRERYGFRAELRATGEVLRDQLVFLQRAGFDAFELKKDRDAAHFADAVARYSVFYQPTGDGRVSALTARLRAGKPQLRASVATAPATRRFHGF